MSIDEMLKRFEEHIHDTLSVLDHRLATDGSLNVSFDRDEEQGQRIFVALAGDDASRLPGANRRVYPVRENFRERLGFDPSVSSSPPNAFHRYIEVSEWEVFFVSTRMRRRVEIIPSLVESGTIVTCAIGFTTLPVVVTKKWRCVAHTECVKSIEMGEACMRAQRAASL